VLWVAYATHSTLKPVPTLPRQRQIAITVWQIPDAVDTVVCLPDDGWWYHPKHVEQFPDNINCVTLHHVGYILEYYYDARTHEGKVRTRRYLCSEEWHWHRIHTCCCGSMKSGEWLARVVRIAFWTDSSSAGNPSDAHLKPHSRTKYLRCNYTHKNTHTSVYALYFRNNNLTWWNQSR